MRIAKSKPSQPIHGVLLVYHHPLVINAPTIMEHVNSFSRYSRFKVWAINTEFGFPRGLSRLQFQVILLHYSLFGFTPRQFSNKFLRYLKRSEASYKIAFFQDEHHFCKRRFEFLNRFDIDCVYTLVEPAYLKDVYQKFTKVPKLVYNIPGYVSDDMIEKAQKYAKPDCDRNIDVGYRGRQLKYYMGKGAQEKYEIGMRFTEYASGSGLKLDIETKEDTRLYGDAWYRFLSDCKACLGVEAGVSIFDTEDIVRMEYERLITENPEITFEQMAEQLLNHWEGNIPYRTISPRHFESAAFRNCQILYEGKYSDIMKPMVHYIPLKKDFSNFDEVMRLFRNEQFRQQITENCYRDLIASGKYSYKYFIDGFDQELLAAGFTPHITQDEVKIAAAAVRCSKIYKTYRWLMGVSKIPYYHTYPGKKVILFFGYPIFKMYGRLREYLNIVINTGISKET